MNRRKASVRIISLLIVGAALCLLSGCLAREPAVDTPPGPEIPAPISTNLPAMATIGGAQDVWPFSFGLDADRSLVESDLGSPETTSSRPAGGSDGAATVETWEYPGLSLAFFVDSAAQIEDLLVARIDSPDVAVGGGLSVGMNADDALALLGEPGLTAGDELVFFYYSTTIEIVIRDGLVAQIALARALP